MATTFPGVRPSISLASRPTATTSPVVLLIATIDGSFTTIPLPPENTSVFAVPRSIARSDENKLNTDLKLYPFLFIPQSPRRRVRLHRRASRPFDGYGAPSLYRGAIFRGAPLTTRPPMEVNLLPLCRLLGHHNRHGLLRRAAAAVLPDHYN